MTVHQINHLRRLIHERVQAELLTPSTRVLALDRFGSHADAFCSIVGKAAQVLNALGLASFPYSNFEQDPPSIGIALGDPLEALLFLWPHLNHPDGVWVTGRLAQEPARSSSQFIAYRDLTPELLDQILCSAVERLLRLPTAAPDDAEASRWTSWRRPT